MIGGATVVLAAVVGGVAVRSSQEAERTAVKVATEPTTSAVPSTLSTIVESPTATEVTVTVAPTTSSSSPAATAGPAATTATTAPRGSTATTATAPPTTPTTAAVRGSEHQVVQAALTAARGRWAAGKPARGYTWRYRDHCFCPPPRQYEVEVDGAGKVIAARGIYTEGTTTSVPARTVTRPHTVESTFKELQDAIDRKAEYIRATFEPPSATRRASPSTSAAGSPTKSMP